MNMRKKIGMEDWDNYSKEVKKYTGYKPIKYEWEGCVGCLTPNEDLPNHPFFNFLKTCRTRKCGTHNEVDNCAYCGRFPCANTVARNDYTIEKVSEKVGSKIDDKTYDQYIRMFDSMTNLKNIRSELKDNQIKNPKPISKKTDITALKVDFKNKGIDTVAGYEQYMQRKDFLWRFIWILGLFGTIKENTLRIDSVTLYENRNPITLPSNEEQWAIYFDILKQFGITTEIEIVTDKLYTLGGYMRARTPKTNKPAYILNMKVTHDLQEYSFFKVLNEIISKLQSKTGKRAFANFKKLNFNSIIL
jgi:hypothetical protein